MFLYDHKYLQKKFMNKKNDVEFQINFKRVYVFLT